MLEPAFLRIRANCSAILRSNTSCTSLDMFSFASNQLNVINLENSNNLLYLSLTFTSYIPPSASYVVKCARHFHVF